MSLFAALHVPSLHIQLIEASRPDLHGDAWVLGLPREGSRAKVLDVSEGARSMGIETGMTLAEVRRAFPTVRILNPDPALVSRFRRVLSALCDARCAAWDVHDDGDAILDLGAVRHLLGQDLSTWAAQFRTDLERSIGIRSSRILLATTRAGAETLVRIPDASDFELVRDDSLEARLGEIPLDSIPWLARSTRDQLSRFQLRTLSDVRRIPHGFLCEHFGEIGERLSALARGVDARSGGPITPTLAEEHVFRGTDSDTAAARERVHELADRLSFALRERQLSAREVRMRLSWDDGQELSSSVLAVPACASFLELRAVAWKLLAELAVRRQPLRSLRLSIPRTEASPVQEDLFSSAGTRSNSDSRRVRSQREARLVQA
jgi:nucleotidyltransferase/DNA polymerase involved in DNA repair